MIHIVPWPFFVFFCFLLLKSILIYHFPAIHFYFIEINSKLFHYHWFIINIFDESSNHSHFTSTSKSTLTATGSSERPAIRPLIHNRQRFLSTSSIIASWDIMWLQKINRYTDASFTCWTLILEKHRRTTKLKWKSDE